MRLLLLVPLLLLVSCSTTERTAVPPQVEQEIVNEAYRFMVTTGRKTFADRASVMVRPVPRRDAETDEVRRSEVWTVSFVERDPFHRILIAARVRVERRTDEHRVEWHVSPMR